MNPESLILAVGISVLVWLMMRRTTLKRRRLAEQRRQQAPGAPVEQRTMPRYGTPGTVTRDQLKALKANNFEPSRHWSREEAALILDALTYARTAIRERTGETEAPIGIQNNVLQFILGDEELREHVRDHGLNRTRAEEESGPLTPKRDERFERILDYVDELWEA